VVCADPEFCNFEPAPDCGGSDRGGTCEAKPSACTRDYRPVCGCDHRTYGNVCSAHAEAVSVLHDGSCDDKDCAAVGGRPVDGIGAGPSCENGEVIHTTIVRSGTTGIAIEGTACCVRAQ
jgi:hypothetical protein